MSVTVVTAWYKIKAKNPVESFHGWIRRFFSIPCNVIIFTDEHSKSDFDDIIPSPNTKIVLLEINEFKTSFFDSYWDYCLSIDYEYLHHGTKHSRELYKIWAEKIFFIERAIHLNPFKSIAFCWSDIGAVRSDDMFPSVYSFPLNLFTFLESDKVCFSSIECFHQSDYQIDENGISGLFKNSSPDLSCMNIVRIQGGFFAGYKKPLLEYAATFYKELKLFSHHKVFGGKDQYIMSNIYLKNPSKYQLLSPDRNIYSDIWFSYLIRGSNQVHKVTSFIQGGLGNQMFQVAIAIAVGLRDHALVWFQKIKPDGPHNITDRPAYWDSMFRKVFSTSEQLIHSAHMIVEDFHHVCHPIPKIQRDTMLKGYFQSAFYFEAFEYQIRLLFQPTEKQVEWCKERKFSEKIGIHVRRTDYVHLKWELPLSYYTDALRKLKSNLDIVCFTDDKEWCSNNLSDCEIITDGSDVDQLFGLSACQFIIMANSSYSWWAAYLSRAKKIYYPKPWFKNENYNNKIALRNWECISW